MCEAEAKEGLRQLLLDYKYIDFLTYDIKKLLDEAYYISEKIKDCSIEVKNILVARTKTLSKEIKDIEYSITKIKEKNKTKVDLINMLEQPQRSILDLHYILGLTYEDIAYKLKYSVARIFQYHKKGIEAYTRLATHIKFV